MDTFSTKALNMSVPLRTAEQPCKTECSESLETKDNICSSNEENNEYNSKMEKDVLSSPKRPGWFGKGYAKNKKARKRRRVR